MVDPLGSAPDSKTRNRTAGGLRKATMVALVGLGGGLAVLLALLVGLLALPWVASGLFFYNAAQATPAANLYQKAQPCAADASTSHCLRLVRGTIATVNRQASRSGINMEFSIELPGGIQSARISTFVVQPPPWLQIGQRVEVTLYEGKITQIAYNGSQADTDNNPVVHEHDLLISGSMCLVFGLILEGGIFIAVRRGKRGSGLPTS